MEKIVSKINTLWAAAVTLFAATFGEYWFLFFAFFVLNVVDYITGIAKARFSHAENSNKGVKGIVKRLDIGLLSPLRSLSPYPLKVWEITSALTLHLSKCSVGSRLQHS